LAAEKVPVEVPMKSHGKSPVDAESSDTSAETDREIEFSRIIRADHIGELGESFSFTADGEECRRLAERCDLLSLNGLEASVEVSLLKVRGAKGMKAEGVRARVKFVADVLQSCVVTLEPVANKVEHGFEVDYLPEGVDMTDAELLSELDGRTEGEVFVDVDEVDPPEVMRDGEFDIGDAIAENLSLALDPYPRAPGVEAVPYRTSGGAAEDDDGAVSPFAVLEKLKNGG